MTGSETPGAAGLEAYLARLDAMLAALPPEERRDILLETRSHVLERAAHSPWRDVNDVLAELGSAEEYAKLFIADGAPAPTRSPVAVDGIARLATSGWRTLPLLFVVTVAYGVAALGVIVAFDKLLNPNDVGLWIKHLDGQRTISLIVNGQRPAGSEILGYWLVPAALVLTVVIHVSMTALFRYLAPREEHRRRTHSGTRPSPRG